MSLIYHNIQRIELGGCCPGESEYIYNVMQVVIDRAHIVTPKRVMHYKPPKGYLQSHSWLTVDLHLLSDHTVLDDYVKDCDDNENICLFKIIIQNPVMYSDPWEWGDPFPATFVGPNVEIMIIGAIPSSYTKQLLNYADSVWVYRFIAQCLNRKVYPPPC